MPKQATSDQDDVDARMRLQRGGKRGAVGDNGAAQIGRERGGEGQMGRATVDNHHHSRPYQLRPGLPEAQFFGRRHCLACRKGAVRGGCRQRPAMNAHQKPGLRQIAQIAANGVFGYRKLCRKIAGDKPTVLRQTLQQDGFPLTVQH